MHSQPSSFSPAESRADSLRRPSGRRLRLMIVAAGLALVAAGGCAVRGVAWRAVRATPGAPAVGQQQDAYYIEGTTPQPNGRTYSCSFVEFDEHGDYLDFRQHDDAKRVVLELAGKDPALLLIIYCHGWQNNADSNDVLRFNRFLSQLADVVPVDVHSDGRRVPLYRVHGIYLAWRGNIVPSLVDREGTEFRQTVAEFGEPIVSARYSRGTAWPLALPEVFSYWSRKAGAEFRVSGVPLARSVMTFGYAAKALAEEQAKLPPSPTSGVARQPNRVYLMGHSFGALMLEKSVGQAIISSVAAKWPWQTERATPDPTKPQPNPLPFDSILLINSAAPSLHSKELSDFLWAHQDANGYGSGTAPLVISVTSEADWATGKVHPVANLDTKVRPSYRRTYKEGVFEAKAADEKPPEVPQSFFYTHTPGHNPLLVEYAVSRTDASAPGARAVPNDARAVIFYNWTREGMTNPALIYLLDKQRAEEGKSQVWEIRKPTDPADPLVQWRDSAFPGWQGRRKGAYWIVRVPKDLIADHSDIWNVNAIELYTALFRLNDWMRLPEVEKAKASHAPAWLRREGG